MCRALGTFLRRIYVLVAKRRAEPENQKTHTNTAKQLKWRGHPTGISPMRKVAADGYKGREVTTHERTECGALNPCWYYSRHIVSYAALVMEGSSDRIIHACLLCPGLIDQHVCIFHREMSRLRAQALDTYT